MKKQFKDSMEITKEFLQEICAFLYDIHDKAQTKGDLLVLKVLTRDLQDMVGFYNEDGEEIDILKGGNHERN